MKIIFVSREYPPSLRLGGISFYVKTIATQLVKEGHTVHVIAASDNVKVKELYVEDGVNVHRLSGADFYVEKTMSTISRIKNKFRQITCYGSYRRNLAKYLFELNLEIGFDVIEFAEFGAESLFWFQKGVSTKTIIRLHGPTLLDRNTGISSKDLSWLQNKRALDELRLLDQASAITSPSIAMANWIQSNRKVIYPIPSIVENAINYPYWSSKLDKKQSINIIHIVSAGTLVKEKGFNELVEACKELRESHLNIKLSIAGRMGQLGRELLNKSKNDKNY
jgi:glycogen(starch) synthase